MMAPAVVLLLGWMLIPLTMTLYFSFKKYLPLRGDTLGGGLDWVGFSNYSRFIGSSAFWPSVQATLIIVGSVLIITLVLGVLLALLLDQPMWGQGFVRILVISPFFVMPTVSALVWKNMFMDPNNGLLKYVYQFFGAEPVQWLTQASMESIIMMVSWQWLPPVLKRFWYIILPHLGRAMTIVILIQTIFLLAIFAEIFVTTGGAFGTKTLTYLIFQRVLESQNIGLGSAGGVYAIILANIIAIFLMRIVGKNLD